MRFYGLENSYWIYHFKKADFSNYLEKIKKNVPENSVVLCDSTLWYAFRNQTCYNDQYLFVWNYAPAYESKKMGKNYEEIFDNFKIEYYITNEDVFSWETELPMIDFLKRRSTLTAVVEDDIYGKATFHPGIKKTFIYKISPKKS